MKLIGILLLCILYANIAYSMREDFEGDSIKYPAITFLPIFSVFKGAKINITFDSEWDLKPLEEDKLLFALARASEATEVSIDTVVGCNYSDFNFTKKIIFNGTGSVDFHHVVEKSDSYYLLLINCQKQPYRVGYSVKGNLSIVSADGGELFAGDAPLIPLLKMFTYIWSALFLFWIILRIKHDCTAHNARRIRYTHDLGKRLPHWTVALIPVTQILYAVLTFSLWGKINIVGTLPQLSGWEGPYSLALFQRISRALMEGVLFGSVFILCTGTRISRRRMTTKDLLIGLACCFAIVICSFFDQNYLPIFETSSMLGWLFHFTCRICVLVVFYLLVSKQIQEQADHGAFESPGSMYPAPNHALYAVFERSRYFRSIRDICKYWMFFEMIYQIFVKIFVSDWSWVIEFFIQFQYLSIFLMLVLTLRERPPPAPVQVRANRGSGSNNSQPQSPMRNEKVMARLQEFVKKQETTQSSSA